MDNSVFLVILTNLLVDFLLHVQGVPNLEHGGFGDYGTGDDEFQRIPEIPQTEHSMRALVDVFSDNGVPSGDVYDDAVYYDYYNEDLKPDIGDYPYQYLSGDVPQGASMYESNVPSTGHQQRKKDGNTNPDVRPSGVLQPLQRLQTHKSPQQSDSLQPSVPLQSTDSAQPGLSGSSQSAESLQPKVLSELLHQIRLQRSKSRKRTTSPEVRTDPRERPVPPDGTTKQREKIDRAEKDIIIETNSPRPRSRPSSPPILNHIADKAEIGPDTSHEVDRGENKVGNVSRHEVSVYRDGDSCDVATHDGCDLENFERCDVITRTCQCLKGFLRDSKLGSSGPCTGANYFQSQFSVGTLLDNVNFTSTDLQSIKARLTQMVEDAFREKGTGSVLDLRFRAIEEQGPRTTFTFEVATDTAFLPRIMKLKESIAENHKGTEDSKLDTDHNKLENENDTVTHLFYSLRRLDPCESKGHNYCHDLAVCGVSGEAVYCYCPSGYKDISPDTHRAPGEICAGLCPCQNDGVCVEEKSGIRMDYDEGHTPSEITCSCLYWYIGAECQIDGKALVIVCSAVTGGLLVLGITACGCYSLCRHRHKLKRPTLFDFSPNTSVLKLPRAWMDTSSCHDDLSPETSRRMSINSGFNPFHDGYILEDFQMNTMSRRGSHPHLGKVPMSNCGGTTSSHSFYRY